MKKSGILNAQLSSAIASMGHTDYFVIADAGLPIPEGVTLIDLSLVRNIPTFKDVLKAVNEELVVESFILASELANRRKEYYNEICTMLEGYGHTLVPHEEFKKFTQKAKFVVKTGETSPYANIILVAGVNF